MFPFILTQCHIFSEHSILAGTRLRKAGPVQYAVHWLYGVSEPVIIRIVDWILRRKYITDTALGRKILWGIAAASWYFPHGVVLTTPMAERLVDFLERAEGPGGARLGVGPCVCQHALNRWQEPIKKDMVLLYGADIYYHLNRGYELISAQEAKEILRKCNEAGLVHSVEFCLRSGRWTFVVCNCDDKICAPLRVFLHTGRMLFPGPQIIAHDRKLCVGVEKCGACIRRCIFGVNFAAKDGGKVALNYEKCMGCGLCISTCIGRARAMQTRPDYCHDHQIHRDILLGEVTSA